MAASDQAEFERVLYDVGSMSGSLGYIKRGNIDPNAVYLTRLGLNTVPLVGAMDLEPIYDDDYAVRRLVIEGLLEAGADPNKEFNVYEDDDSGFTLGTTNAFTVAIENADVEAVELMLESGADPRARLRDLDQESFTPWDKAQEMYEEAKRRSIRRLEWAISRDSALKDTSVEGYRQIKDMLASAMPTKAARVSRAQIRAALVRFDGDHKAAARFLAGRRR